MHPPPKEAPVKVVDFKFPGGINPLDLVPKVPLGSSSVNTKLLSVPLAPNQSYSFGGLTLNLRPTLGVYAFNSPDDNDEDRILAAGPSGTPDGALAPQLTFRSDGAWLKYALEADIKAAGAATLASLGFKIDATAGAAFTDYRSHAGSLPVVEAVASDLINGPRFATALDHVLDLSAGDALSVRWVGTLNTEVQLAWTDVFAGPALALGALAGVHGVIGLELTSGARVAFSVGISDDFVVVFSRTSEDLWRIGIRKATSRSAAASASVGIKAGFANPNAPQEILNSALEAVLGQPLAQVDAILSAASLDRLSDAQKKAAALLVKRLAGRTEVATLVELRDRVQQVRDALPNAIDELAKAKVRLAFAYEYSRIDENASVLQVTVHRSLLQKHHPGLIRGRLDGLIADVTAEVPGMHLETYLNQKTLVRERSWGFTLGIGKWGEVGGKDFKRVSRIERRNIRGKLQDSYLGARGYTGQWIGERFGWTVDLKADMPAFAVHDTPLVTEYDFGIHLVWTANQKKLSADECEQWLDSAIIWGVVPEHDLDVARERLGAMVNQQCDVALQVAVPDDALRAMLPAIASAAAASFAPALATAMPWHAGGGRTSAARRRELYAPLWALYLREPHSSPADLSRAAATHFETRQLRDLAFIERRFDTARPFTFAGLVELNGDTHAACRAFTRGFSIIQSAIAAGAPNNKTIDKAFGAMDDLWTQSHHVRAVGAYLIDAASDAGVLRMINRTMTVTSGRNTVVLTA